MHGYKIADWAENAGDIVNANDNPLYKQASLIWQKPVLWQKGQKKPQFDTTKPFVYALIRNHGSFLKKDHIEYIGLTKSPKTRFGNHKTALEIVAQHGTVHFTYAPIDFIAGKNQLKRIGAALEEIEHLLIWTVNEHLINQKKQYTLPGLGLNGGNAWHIKNSGYRFKGQMPQEIIYPWMLIRPGRNKTAK